MMLPKRRTRPKMGVRPDAWIRSQPHQQWVRGFHCICQGLFGHVCSGPIVFAHCRLGTDGAAGEKPSDCYGNPMCDGLHTLQHTVGEPALQRMFNIDLKASSIKYWLISPHRRKWDDHPANPLRKDGRA